MSEELEYIMTEPYQRGYKKGKVDAIDEFVAEIKRIYFDNRTLIRCCELVAYSLKEQKK